MFKSSWEPLKIKRSSNVWQPETTKTYVNDKGCVLSKCSLNKQPKLIASAKEWLPTKVVVEVQG